MEPQAEQAEKTETNSVVTVDATPTTKNKHVTSYVPATKPVKHPSRVACGKALAERNRITREAKTKKNTAAKTTTSSTKRGGPYAKTRANTGGTHKH